MTSPFTSVVEVTLGGDGSGGDALDWWAVEGAAVRRALVEHYGRDIAGDALTPPHEPGELRSRLRGAAPRLSELTTRVRRAFDEQLACAVIVPQFGVTDADTDDKRKAVFAFGALIGDPTANLPFDQVFWDVKNNGAKATRHTAFSENDRDADYHADNGSFRAPERFFLLYVVREACCGGGVSMIRDGRVLITQLERTPQGRRAVEVLKKAVVPRRVPRAFHQYADVAADGYKYSPVLATSLNDPPLWRWRKDRVYGGLAKHPEYATDEVRQAVDLVTRTLEQENDQLRYVMPTDGLLVVNNHLALHGRTAFTDPARHLLRLRFHEPSA